MSQTSYHRFVTLPCNNGLVDAVAVTAPLTTAAATSVPDRPKRVRKPKVVFDPSATPKGPRVVAEADEEILAESLANTIENVTIDYQSNLYTLPAPIIVPTDVTDYQSYFSPYLNPLLPLLTFQ